MKTFHTYISASRHPIETIATDFTAIPQEKTFLCLLQVLFKAKSVTTGQRASLLSMLTFIPLEKHKRTHLFLTTSQKAGGTISFKIKSNNSIILLS